MQVSTRFWPTFQQVVRRQKLMLRIMEAMGVNVPEAMRVDGGLAFLEAQGKCATARATTVVANGA